MVVSFLVGGVFLLAGIIGIIFPPKKINGIYGYRSARSMKSPEAWKLGNLLSMRFMATSGFVMIMLGCFLPWHRWSNEAGVAIAMGIMVLAMLLMFWITEYQLRKKESDYH